MINHQLAQRALLVLAKSLLGAAGVWLVVNLGGVAWLIVREASPALALARLREMAPYLVVVVSYNALTFVPGLLLYWWAQALRRRKTSGEMTTDQK